MLLRVTIFVALVILAIEAKKYEENVNDEQWQEFEEFLKWKKAKEAREKQPREIRYDRQVEERRDVGKVYAKQQQNPPPIDQGALMARYIVNQADWAAVATISTRKEVESFPVANLVAFSDGVLGNGSGIPYLYLTPLDFTAQDLAKDHRATLLLSLAQGDYCKSKSWDPMDPRCARVMLSGKIKAVKNDSLEHDIAKNAIFGRHPALIHMPADHHFYFAKLKISSIVVLDTFGGPKYVTVRDYLHPPTSNVTKEFLQMFSIDRTSENNAQPGFNPDSISLNPAVYNV